MKTSNKVNFRKLDNNSCVNCIYYTPSYEGEAGCANTKVIESGCDINMHRDTHICDEHKHKNHISTYDEAELFIPNILSNPNNLTVRELLATGKLLFGYVYDSTKTTIRDSDDFFDGFRITIHKITCKDCIYLDDCLNLDIKNKYNLCNQFSLLLG